MEDENTQKILSEKMKSRDHLEQFGVDKRMILKWILKKQCVKVWTGITRIRIGYSGGLL
jgi:hypothetical protein